MKEIQLLVIIKHFYLEKVKEPRRQEKFKSKKRYLKIVK